MAKRTRSKPEGGRGQMGYAPNTKNAPKMAHSGCSVDKREGKGRRELVGGPHR